MNGPVSEPGSTNAPDAYPVLSQEQREDVGRYGSVREMKAGDILWQDGDDGYDFHLVLAGRVGIFSDYGKPTERLLTEHTPGRFVGEYGLLTGQAAYLTAVAREDGRTVQVTPERLRELIADDPGLSDLILRAFIARRAILIGQRVGLKIVGSRYSPDTRRLLEYVARNRLAHTWLDVETDSTAEAMLRDFSVMPDQTPVVITGGRVLNNPSNSQLALAIGVTHDPAGRAVEVYDAVIVGTGPAGLAAAVYGASEGLSTLALEAVATGGQAGTSTKIENYLGFPAGITGLELATRASLQAEKFNARIVVPGEAISVGEAGDLYTVTVAGNLKFGARALVVATGASYRRLDVPRMPDFEGVGVYYAATQSEVMACSGSEVAIVGGGNSAGQAALFLSKYVQRVYVLVRRAGLEETMSRYLIDQMDRVGSIEVLGHCEVQELVGDGALSAIVVRHNQDRSERRLDVTALFVFIGATPRTTWLEGFVTLDPKGFVLTGRDLPDAPDGRIHLPLETSRPGIFAVGDVRSGSIKRVASAVGEGSMAIRLVHDHLLRQPG